MTQQDRDELATVAADALATIDDNGDFDHAREHDPQFPHEAYGQAVVGLRRLRDQLRGSGDYLDG